MAPWVFLFGLTMSCVLVWGAGAETLHATLRDKVKSLIFGSGSSKQFRRVIFSSFCYPHFPDEETEIQRFCLG